MFPRWLLVLDNHKNKNLKDYLGTALFYLCKYDIKFHSFRNKRNEELHIIIECDYYHIFRIRKLLQLHLPIIRISKYINCSYSH